MFLQHDGDEDGEPVAENVHEIRQSVNEMCRTDDGEWDVDGCDENGPEQSWYSGEIGRNDTETEPVAVHVDDAARPQHVSIRT